jgi:hypothetical protein
MPERPGLLRRSLAEGIAAFAPVIRTPAAA